ncbi:GD13523 [Drosophila simulans]|uniref:GD13523 n=1 Tax=Drosophila simulans TaxID=7240 RepID=B4QLD2_DROSI|nr:GD13523 [Drosophila simulans]
MNQLDQTTYTTPHTHTSPGCNNTTTEEKTARTTKKNSLRASLRCTVIKSARSTFKRHR